jgi:hypothetical protein
MTLEEDIRRAKERLAQAQTLYKQAREHLANVEKMSQQAKYDLVRLEKKAQEVEQQALEATFIKFEPFVCAIQYASHHSYSREPPKVETTYICDGKNVYVQGTTKPISKYVLARHAHYGSMGRGGKYDSRSILELVKRHFLDYFLGKDTETPKPLEFSVSFCGN